MDTKPDGAGKAVKDMTPAEYRAARAEAIRQAAARQREADDKADLTQAAARYARRGTAA